MDEKTIRIIWMCCLLAFLGGLFFMFKIEACATCDSNNNGRCRDQFYEVGNGNYHTCPAGARAELVTSPPAPKPGLLCHCKENDPYPIQPATDAAAK